VTPATITVTTGETQRSGLNCCGTCQEVMGRRHPHSNHRCDTAQRTELLRDVRGGDGTPATITVTTGATQHIGLNCCWT
jgi:hypothetical protein